MESIIKTYDRMIIWPIQFLDGYTLIIFSNKNDENYCWVIVDKIAKKDSRCFGIGINDIQYAEGEYMNPIGFNIVKYWEDGKIDVKILYPSKEED